MVHRASAILGKGLNFNASLFSSPLYNEHGRAVSHPRYVRLTLSLLRRPAPLRSELPAHFFLRMNVISFTNSLINRFASWVKE